MRKKTNKDKNEVEEVPVFWFETSGSVCRRYQFESDGHLSVCSC